MFPRKEVETANGVSNHGVDQQFGEAFERETMHTRTEALLDCADRPLHFANVTVGRDNVHGNRKHGGAKAFEFGICVDVADDEAAGVVQVENGPDFAEEGAEFAIRDGSHGAETNAARNGV